MKKWADKALFLFSPTKKPPQGLILKYSLGIYTACQGGGI